MKSNTYTPAPPQIPPRGGPSWLREARSSLDSLPWTDSPLDAHPRSVPEESFLFLTLYSVS